MTQSIQSIPCIIIWQPIKEEYQIKLQVTQKANPQTFLIKFLDFSDLYEILIIPQPLAWINLHKYNKINLL